ncbi:hypothetical protein M3J09_003518 [Ascochyta lentis]
MSAPTGASRQSQETAIASAERAPRTAITDDHLLSRIENILAAQQENTTRIGQTQADPHESFETKRMSAVSDKNNTIIQILEQLLAQKGEELQRAEDDLSAEKIQLVAVTNEHNTSVQALEQFIAQMKQEQQFAEEKWLSEVKGLKEQAERAAEARDLALKDAAAAQTAAETARKCLDTVKAEAEAERNLTRKRESAVVEARRKSDEDHKKQFQSYERLLKTSRESIRQSKPVIHQPVRQTRIMDKHRSIEVNEYMPDTTGSPSALPFSPLKFFQNDSRRPESDVQYYESSLRPTRERHSSFHSSSASLQSPRLSSASMSKGGTGSESQQMILLPSKIDRDSRETSKLQASLERSSVLVTFDDPQNSAHGELVPFNEGNAQVVRSTLFWEPPALALGSELLLTMRRSGWKPAYSRKSATGRTYFYGDQPIHSYFFRSHYTPQFSPPVSSNHEDIIMIDGALVEEYALRELDFNFRRTTTAEYELDGWLTFGDIEGLIERSFMLRENQYRAYYRQPPAVQWTSQPTTPGTQTRFDQHCTSSTTSTTSGSSKGSRANTQRDHGDEEGFESSQTSQLDRVEVKSVWGGDCDVTPSPSVASWVEKTTNPFRVRAPDGKANGSNNPWGQQGGWDGISLI